ncbi:MinD/ParA family protein [Aetokthonos hydrillicola Thurmond2011]|jgi:MinD-like ATPase involved in chromosome partitioning or flagellar assembly|uniref:MinD/ParA family protein n=1 Tax=Aetokthonos hydrillicola Thurmond2011 TaxID=2712845 RepID=A0AAP5IDP2_9CYAN|nr:MinD/ParA family protein [Aetokthonos hydrillicola]MBO3458650.1 MinD/ParA family protein [Aetokthonos hydrillicola CCALA 1050]MBW4588003.1 MinD/ParA family protein [Aetokthonos hydrillicola CCALA 1050]MDR9897045.1 MinD/ParA family protein [Aetokthonos hydrillicola Thurmond2011]
MTTIVSVHSFRGGTGKSNLTANLGATLARSGKRVGIVDTDIQSPGIHTLFNLNEQSINHTLNDYLWKRCSIKEAAHDVSDKLRLEENNGKSIKGCLYLIPSSIKASDIARVLREGYDVIHLNDGFHELSDCLNLDYLLIDTHPGLNEETLLSIGISHILVVLLRPDNQDFQGTAVTIDVARKLKVPHMMLVINKVLQTLNFEDLQQQVESTYNVSVAGMMPLSEDIVQLASHDLFCTCYPEHPICQTFEGIAAQIASVEQS